LHLVGHYLQFLHILIFGTFYELSAMIKLFYSHSNISGIY